MDDIFARRRPASELFQFEVEMLVLPRRQRAGYRGLEFIEPDDRPGPLVESSADGRFSQVEMPVAPGVVALAVERRVFFRRKLFALQAMGRAKRRLQAQEKAIAVPVLRK